MDRHFNGSVTVSLKTKYFLQPCVYNVVSNFGLISSTIYHFILKMFRIHSRVESFHSH